MALYINVRVYWLINLLTDWLTDWLINWLAVIFHSSPTVNPFPLSFVQCSVRSPWFFGRILVLFPCIVLLCYMFPFFLLLASHDVFIVVYSMVIHCNFALWRSKHSLIELVGYCCGADWGRFRPWPNGRSSPLAECPRSSHPRLRGFGVREIFGKWPAKYFVSSCSFPYIWWPNSPANCPIPNSELNEKRERWRHI